MWCSFSRGWTVGRIWTGWSADWRRFRSCLAAARHPGAPMPERVLSPREALFARTERLPLEGCAGRVSAVQLAPYPPGVPVVAPGERITEKRTGLFAGNRI